MTCEVRNKEINSQCAELLVRSLYIVQRIMYYRTSTSRRRRGLKRVTRSDCD